MRGAPAAMLVALAAVAACGPDDAGGDAGALAPALCADPSPGLDARIDVPGGAAAGALELAYPAGVRQTLAPLDLAERDSAGRVVVRVPYRTGVIGGTSSASFPATVDGRAWAGTALFVADPAHCVTVTVVAAPQ